MLRNRIFEFTTGDLRGRFVIDLEKVCTIQLTDFKTIEIIFDNKSFCLEGSTNTIDRLFQQFIEYKTACPCTPPLKKPLPKSELLKAGFKLEPQTIFEVLQDICEKNDLRFGQAIASIFGSDVDLFYNTNEELLQIISEKKIQLNLK